MCFFVGNDFIPHLPSLDIRAGALDMLMDIYKQLLPELGGYITDMGTVCDRYAECCSNNSGKYDKG